MQLRKILLLLCTFALLAHAEERRISVERLTDLNIPRSGHKTLLVGNTVYVFVGHTSGFVATHTAEYYEDGT